MMSRCAGIVFLLLSCAGFSHAQDEVVPGAQPPTMDSFETQTLRPLSIDEAVIIALDNNPYLHVLRYQVPLAGAAVQEESGVFDPEIAAGAMYRRIDAPLTSQVTAAGTTATSQLSRNFLPHPDNSDHVSYTRQLPGGATASLNYELPAESIDPAGDFRIVNPAWRSGISAVIEQPLLRGAGTRITHAKIHIARNVYQVARNDIQAAMNKLARDIRLSYWDLAYAHRFHQIQLQAKQRSQQMVQQELKRSAIGASNRANVAQSKELLQRVMIAALDSRQLIVNGERALRATLGIDGFDGTQFELVDRESSGQILPWEQALHQALISRPEINAQRHRINAATIEVQRRCNELQPELNLLGRLSTTGLGTSPDVAVGNSLEFDHGEAAIGFSYRRSVNQTAARARLRSAQLSLAQEQAVLKQLEYDVRIGLQRSFQDMYAKGERLKLVEDRVTAAAERLETSRQQFENLRSSQVDFLLRAIEAVTDAEVARAGAVLAYRRSVEDWSYHSGGLMAQWAGIPSDH